MTDHLPYGIFSPDGEAPRVGVRDGDDVVDLAAATGRDDLARPSLNEFMSAGRDVWEEVRALAVEAAASGEHRHALADVTLHLPFRVADYVDFYASEHHASNVGAIFRPDGDALTPNWKHLPIGYHGRSSTVVVSGTDVVRPTGQRKAPDADDPTYGPPSGSTSRPSSASSSASARISARACRPERSPTTSSASSASTTGPRATSRRGSTSPSARSSASRSRRRSRRG